tara:strand:- start:462 stop:1046 length:585 start_codon:yes stop_codon:yes gene_type:complete
MIEIFKHGNSGIDIFKYKGQTAMQVVGVEDAFTKLAENLKDNPVKRIVELGTDYGGLTNLLADNEISKDADIHTFDINGQRFKSHNNKIKFYNQSFESAYEQIKSLIESEGRVLLLCDGGNKEAEFAAFHRYLKDGDIIMGHDYAPNRQEFLDNFHGKIWNWHEFEDSFANFKNLEPFMQEVFYNYAWCIRIKN